MADPPGCKGDRSQRGHPEASQLRVDPVYCVVDDLPARLPDATDQRNVEGVVARNLIYSFADIASKAVYGILLAVIAQKLSALRGYQPAIDAEEAFAEQNG